MWSRPLGLVAAAGAVLTLAALAAGCVPTRAAPPANGRYPDSALTSVTAQCRVVNELAQPLRAALTGQTTSPGIFDVLALLGREESLARIDAQAAR